MTDEKYKIMLAGYIDGELTPEESAEFERHLKDDPELQKELESFRKLKEVTGAMKYADVPEVIWENYWAGLYRRLERGFGWIFVSIAVIVISAFGCYHLFKDFFFNSTAPVLIRIAVAAGILGVIVLLVSIIRERVFAYTHDRYREVKR